MKRTSTRTRKTGASSRVPAAARIPKEVTIGVAAALDKKAIDLVALDLRKASAFTDFFVICTGANARQVQAIGDAIEAALKAEGVRPALVEGRSRADWILLDYFDCIFHIFTPATRDFYSLERLWADAEKIEIPA